MTKVSIVMPSYNHARFIGEAISSVLGQTHEDIELVVVDDGSKDNSNEIISSIKDSRLIHVPLERNVGACEAMNIAIMRSSGEFIAVCNSDDVWEHNKIEIQLQAIQSSDEVGAVFSDVSWIDENGIPRANESLPKFASIFQQPNRSRFSWQRHLIEYDNCLCHPSVLIRRKVYDEVGLYDNMLRQLPDLDMWLRVLQSFEIIIIADQLVRFRIHDNNTSKQSDTNATRTWAERNLIARRYFGDLSADNFYTAFGFSDEEAYLSGDKIALLREKIGYLVSSRCFFRGIFHDIGVEMAYFGALKYRQELLPALEFQNLTAGYSARMPRKSDKRRSSKRALGHKLYEALRAWNRKRLQCRRGSK